MALTGKRKLFADAVLAGKSNRDAAIAAGYSAKTASAAGSRLVKDPKVVDYLREQKKGVKAAAPAPAEPPPSKPFNLALALQHDDPKAFLKAAMNDLELDPRQRIDAAKALMPFVHHKLGEGGKKDEKEKAARAAGSGKFGAPPPPRLVSSRG